MALVLVLPEAAKVEEVCVRSNSSGISTRALILWRLASSSKNSFLERSHRKRVLGRESFSELLIFESEPRVGLCLTR